MSMSREEASKMLERLAFIRDNLYMYPPYSEAVNLAISALIEKPSVSSLEHLKAEVRKLPRYTSCNGILFPDAKGELVETGAVLALLSPRGSDAP